MGMDASQMITERMKTIHNRIRSPREGEAACSRSAWNAVMGASRAAPTPPRNKASSEINNQRKAGRENSGVF